MCKITPWLTPPSHLGAPLLIADSPNPTVRNSHQTVAWVSLFLFFIYVISCRHGVVFRCMHLSKWLAQGFPHPTKKMCGGLIMKQKRSGVEKRNGPIRLLRDGSHSVPLSKDSWGSLSSAAEPPSEGTAFVFCLPRSSICFIISSKPS